MYRLKYKIELKKNQTQQILVKYASFNNLLKFRWTLFSDNRLVLFRAYNQEAGQYIMRDNNYYQDSIRLNLTNVAVGYNVLPYIILQFKKFDYLTHKAIFLLYLFDNTSMVRLKFLNKETKAI